jgi:pimeloyl-ACP methyl ester carboxylesterase
MLFHFASMLEARPLCSSSRRGCFFGTAHGGSARRVVRARGATSGGALRSLPLETDRRGVERLAYQPEGYSTWQWNHASAAPSHKINYVSAGDSGPIVVLVHGFGASAYHWRYVIPGLAEKCRVYALDCLGFGLSDKALVDYEGYGIWKDQISDFIREVVRPGENEKVVLVGNSLGGYNSLATAAAHPELVEKVVLLNSAGRFDPNASMDDAENKRENESFLQKLAKSIKRAVVGATFLWTKQPYRVQQVLKSVYVSHDTIDEELVESILRPADDPRAGEVFYRVITSRGTPVNLLLDELDKADIPIFLLWGEGDPWCVPSNADKIEAYYGKKAKKLFIKNAGHCPHDDAGDVVVKELLEYLEVV